ncbi:MAG TPA: PKD domain-containing protein, partial [Chthoniobacteraceae bacterium]|nr:PKD domain-containing protein [Chthoniobacteraceae bacterium]
MLFCLEAMRLSASDVSQRIEMITGKTRSSLDRPSGLVTSTVDVTLKNIGDRPLDGPLHAAVQFTAESGALDGIQVPGALGGIGQPPHGTFFYDLSAQTGNALAPQASTTFTLRFTPARGARVSYRIVTFANVDLDPAAQAGGPYSGRVGAEIVFDGSASTDPEAGALTFRWQFGDGTPPAQTVVARHTFATPGIFEAKLTVTDPRGHAGHVTVPVTIRPAADFAVARVRSLDGAGLPLSAVSIEERRNGVLKNRVTRGNGFAPLANGAGDYLWKFSKPGHLSVWRSAHVAVGEIVLIPDPWLAKQNPTSTALSPLNDAQIDSPAKSVRVHFNSGAFPQPAQATVTELTPQSLPLPLPIGWSPFAQFHLALSAAPAEPGSATLALRGVLGAGQQAILVSFDEATQTWIAGESVPGDGSATATVPISKAGTFALVLPDAAPFTPPPVDAGESLAATTQSFTVENNVAATGTVDPAISAASRDPEKVTARARVTFSQSGPLPSGLFFPTRISESYQLQAEGDALRTPDYDATIFAYARPGPELAAEFPMRPQLLLGAEELREATIRCAVFPQSPFSGAVIDGTGGVLSGGGVKVEVPPNAVTEVQPAELTPLDPQSFGKLGGAIPPTKAFSLSIGDLAAGVSLRLSVEGLDANHNYVLGLVVSDGRRGGITPVERFITDANGQLVSAEPATG